MKESYNDFETQHYVQWQVAAFRLPAAQQEASGWWDAPSWLSRLYPKDFLPITNASSPKDFWVMRQEKTLALAQALQACTKGSRAPTGVLCGCVWELQKCMTPLMTLSGDDIMVASLLKPTEEEHGTSPMQEEKAILLGEEVILPKVPGSLLECLEISKLVEPVKQTNAASTSLAPSPTTQPGCHTSRKVKTPWREIELIWTIQKSGSTPTCRGMEECQNGGGSSDLFSTPRTSASVMSKSKGWSTYKPQPSGCQQQNRKKDGSWSTLPHLGSWSKKTFFPQLSSREPAIIEWWGMKKWWHWPWLSRDVPFIPEHLLGCSVEQCKGSADTSPPYLRGEIY